MTSGFLGSTLSTGFQGLVGYKVGTVLAKNETQIKPRHLFYSGHTMEGASKTIRNLAWNNRVETVQSKIERGGFEWRREGMAWKGPWNTGTQTRRAFIGTCAMSSGREGANEASEDTESGRDFSYLHRKIRSKERMISFVYFWKMKHWIPLQW